MTTSNRTLFHAEVLRQKTLALHPDYRETHIRLDDDDRAVLRRVNGQATVATLGHLTGLSDEAMTRIVLRLVARKKLVFADELPFIDETALAAAVLERVAGAEPAKLLRLDETDQALLALVDGQTRARDVARTVGGDRALVFLNLIRLVNAGLLRIDRSARPPALPVERQAAERTVSSPAREPAVGTEERPAAPVAAEAPSGQPAPARRSIPRRWLAVASLVVSAGVLTYVAVAVLGSVKSRLVGEALTVEGLADVIELAEIKLQTGKHWSAVARDSFGRRTRPERVRAAQELVRRVQAAGFRDVEVSDESGVVLFECAGAVLVVHDLARAAPESGGSPARE